jgi:CBS domain-containing protein
VGHPADHRIAAPRVRTGPKRIGVLVARTSRILNAATLDEVVAETADGVRRVLRAERAVAMVTGDDLVQCCGQSPRWDPADASEPTTAVPLVARTGRRLGAVQVWTRDGAALPPGDEQVLLGLAHCASTIIEAMLARRPGVDQREERFARVVHDLRTPLAAVLSWTWTLKQGLDGPRAARAVAAIERNAVAQSRLLDQVTEELLAVGSHGTAGAGHDESAARRSPSGPAASSHEGGSMQQRLRDVMTTGVATVAPGDTIRYAAERMNALDVGSLPVCDGERLMGVVTDRDIAVRAVAVGRDPNRTAVIEAMTSSFVFGYEQQAIDEAVDLMREHEIRRLPVVDDNRRLVGIVALADLAIRGPMAAASEALDGVSRPRPAEG